MLGEEKKHKTLGRKIAKIRVSKKIGKYDNDNNQNVNRYTKGREKRTEKKECNEVNEKWVNIFSCHLNLKYCVPPNINCGLHLGK